MYNRVREMFYEEPEEEIIRRYGGRTLWCDFPDWDEVTAFLFYHNCSLTDITGLKNNLYQNRGLIFPDGDLGQDRDQDQQDEINVVENQPMAPKAMVLNQQKKMSFTTVGLWETSIQYKVRPLMFGRDFNQSSIFLPEMGHTLVAMGL
jgi:hypothetical protein